MRRDTAYMALINEERDYEQIKKYRNTLVTYWSSYQWEWFCTLNLPIRCNYSSACSFYKKWRLSLGVDEGLRVSSVGVYNDVPHQHMHLLMSGTNSKNSSLLAVDKKIWEREWQSIARCEAFIKIYDGNRCIKYMAFKNTPVGHHELMEPYNMRSATSINTYSKGK
jgi:hypothetical protein